jgi:hypothetical protein
MMVGEENAHCFAVLEGAFNVRQRERRDAQAEEVA